MTRGEAVQAAIDAGAVRVRFAFEAVALAAFLGARPWDGADAGWEFRPGLSDHDTRLGTLRLTDCGPFVSVYPVYPVYPVYSDGSRRRD